jgi:putative ABC transport system permease protein
MDYLVDVYLAGTQREDVTVTFVDPRPPRALGALDAMPGVLHAEGMRALPVKIRAGHFERQVVAFGYPPDLQLRVLLDSEDRPVELPARGALLTTTLAEILHVRAGDSVVLAPLEGERRPREVWVAGLVDEMFGIQVHMRTSELHRVLGETETVSTALLAVDHARLEDVLSRLRDFPAVSGAVRRDASIAHFRAQSAESTHVMAMVLTLFAATIALGVVYNNARIALSVRGRDLASLRVLGFTRAEIAGMLLLELGLQIAAAIPLGWVVGYLMTGAILRGADQEAYRLVPMVSARTYAFATAVTLAAALLSALLVRRKLDRLDLIGVLKTRE